MSKQEKRRKELARRAKRRKTRPQSAWLSTGPKSSTKLMKQVSRQHADVLQNIESALLSSYREDDQVDDAVVFAALEASIAGKEPTDLLVAELVDQLAAVREFRLDQLDEVWRDCLRVVRDSVKLHSSLSPGDTSYLNFVSRYVV